MQVKAHGYMHSSNGLSLQLIPETEVEEALLKIIWQHGKLETGHPCGEQGAVGYRVSWDQRDDSA